MSSFCSCAHFQINIFVSVRRGRVYKFGKCHTSHSNEFFNEVILFTSRKKACEIFITNSFNCFYARRLSGAFVWVSKVCHIFAFSLLMTAFFWNTGGVGVLIYPWGNTRLYGYHTFGVTFMRKHLIFGKRNIPLVSRLGFEVQCFSKQIIYGNALYHNWHFIYVDFSRALCTHLKTWHVVFRITTTPAYYLAWLFLVAAHMKYLLAF